MMNHRVLKVLYSAFVAAALCTIAAIPQALAQDASPKYKADVPKSIQAPDTVETERLGTLKFFDGMPDDAAVKKAYDNLDFQRGVHRLVRPGSAQGQGGCLGPDHAGEEPAATVVRQELESRRFRAGEITGFASTTKEIRKE